MTNVIRLDSTRAISKAQIAILQALADHGPTPASLFNEEELDALFKLRPRLICLVRGHTDAVVDVTGEGMRRLTALAREAS